MTRVKTPGSRSVGGPPAIAAVCGCGTAARDDPPISARSPSAGGVLSGIGLPAVMSAGVVVAPGSGAAAGVAGALADLRLAEVNRDPDPDACPASGAIAELRSGAGGWTWADAPPAVILGSTVPFNSGGTGVVAVEAGICDAGSGVGVTDAAAEARVGGASGPARAAVGTGLNAADGSPGRSDATIEPRLNGTAGEGCTAAVGLAPGARVTNEISGGGGGGAWGGERLPPGLAIRSPSLISSGMPGSDARAAIALEGLG